MAMTRLGVRAAVIRFSQWKDRFMALAVKKRLNRSTIPYNFLYETFDAGMTPAQAVKLWIEHR